MPFLSANDSRHDFIECARLLVALIGLEALIMTAPLLMAIVGGEGGMVKAWLLIIVPTLLITVPVTFIPGKIKIEIRAAEGFPLVVAVWLVICLVGALPFTLSGVLPDYSAALFESTSGFTTTGMSMIADVESVPPSLNLWRAIMHWLGGMGIILLTVALVPFLGTGAFQLLKAETPGPDKGRFTPKITTQAQILWLVYVGLTLAEIILLMAGGMSAFDAVFHAFSTMGTGGFSCRNNSILYYNSVYIEWVCIIFMTLAGLNFTLVYKLLRGDFAVLKNNSEAKAYITIILAAALIIAISIFPGMVAQHHGGTIRTFIVAAHDAFRAALFHTVSIITTTGFMSENHALWPPLAQCALFMVMFIGGCSGSTAGGIKVVRYVVLAKQMKNELKKMLYPRGVFLIQIDGKPGQRDVVRGVASFMFAYFLLLLSGALLAASSGIDIWNAANTSLITVGNIGLGLGKLITGQIIIDAPAYVRYGLSFLMLTGRLEMLSVLVLFTRGFWHRA